MGTSTVLAAAIRKAAPDLVICGMASTDGSMGVLPSMIAERLGWPAATLAAELSVADGTVTIRRDGDTASLTVEAPLPAVVSVTDQSGEARYPSMKGILAAKEKPVEVWTLADVGVEPGAVGLAAAWSKVTSADPRPPRRPAAWFRTRTGRDRPHWSSSWPPASTSEQPPERAENERLVRMAEVLVVAELVEGVVTKPTCELVTLARRLGDPVVVVFGDGAEAVAAKVGQYGATRVLSVTDPAIDDYLVAPKAEALAQVAESLGPAAVLLTSTAEGKEVAGRLAIKLGSGLITDATDIAGDGTTTQSVFAGSYRVTASVEQGAPVVTVKPNAVTPEPAASSPAVEPVAVTISDAAKTARITAREPKQASGRPRLTEAAVVVSGGRGTGGDFSEVEALADALHGAVGASRPRSTRAGTRTPTRSGRPARPSPRSSTWPPASPGRSSTRPVCRRPRRWSR